VRKQKAGGEGKGIEERERRGKGINLPHGRLKTLAALRLGSAPARTHWLSAPPDSLAGVGGGALKKGRGRGEGNREKGGDGQKGSSGGRKVFASVKIKSWVRLVYILHRSVEIAVKTVGH